MDPAATWTKEVLEISDGFLLAENGDFLCQENGGKILLNSADSWTQQDPGDAAWSKETPSAPSWTKEVVTDPD